MSDEQILKKYKRLEKRIQKVDSERFPMSTRLVALFLTIWIFIWIVNFFSTIDLNPITILGFGVAFIILYPIVIFCVEIIRRIFEALIGIDIKIRHQLENYKSIISSRVQPDNIHYEFTDKFPVVKQKYGYFTVENGKVIFNVQKSEGVFPIILPKENIAINYSEDYVDAAEYRQFAKRVKEGIFKDIIIGDYKELNIPAKRKMNY